LNKVKIYHIFLRATFKTTLKMENFLGNVLLRVAAFFGPIISDQNAL